MDTKRHSFSFYFVWVIIFTVVNVGVIFLFETFDLLSFIKKDKEEGTTIVSSELLDISQSKDKLRLQEENTKENNNNSFIQEPNTNTPDSMDYKNEVLMSETTFMQKDYTIAPYFSNASLFEDARFLDSDGTSFQVGYLTFTSIFPYQFSIPIQKLPTAFQNAQNNLEISIRLLLGWDTLTAFSVIEQQVQQEPPPIRLRLPVLSAFKIEFSGSEILDDDIKETVHALIRQDIESQLEENVIHKELKSRTLRILGTQYTLKGFQDITMSFIK